jgi:hypothetical protein
MALGFGRKKPADDAAQTPDIEAAPVAAHAPASPSNPEVDAFDFDAFSDTNASSGVAANVPGSAFDFPEDSASDATIVEADDASAPDFDQLYAIERANAAQTTALDATPVPFVPPTATVSQDATPFYEPQIPVEAENEAPPKKKLPLVPILGTLAFLALAGGAASYFAGQSATETEETAPALSSQTATRPAAPAQNAMPDQTAASVKVVKLKPVPVVVDPLPAGATVSPVNPGIAPTSAQMSQLKALWKRGAAAKHRGDYAGARRYWNQGLKIQPDNVGFRESIAKLPR